MSVVSAFSGESNDEHLGAKLPLHCLPRLIQIQALPRAEKQRAAQEFAEIYNLQPMI